MSGTYPIYPTTSGVRIVDMPDLGDIDASSSLVGERAGSGRFSAPALLRYINAQAAPSLYVSVSGSDSNDGLSAATPFLTIQKAVDYAQAHTPAGNSAAQIFLAHGTYTAGCTITRAGLSIYLTGDAANPTAVYIADASSAACAIIAYNSCGVVLQGLGIASVHGGGIFASYSARVYIAGQMIFGPCSGGHLHAETAGFIQIGGSYTINGFAPAHVECMIGGAVIFNESAFTVTLTGTPSFSNAFVVLSDLSYAYIPYSFVAFSGAATGKRYNIESNSVCEVLNAPATFLPGSLPGVTQSGGVVTPYPAPAIAGFTGLGTGGNAVLVTNSTNRDGMIQLLVGSASGAASGDVTLTASDGGGVTSVVPIATLASGSTNWANTATIRITGATNAATTFHWDNGGTALTASQSYYISYKITPI